MAAFEIGSTKLAALTTNAARRLRRWAQHAPSANQALTGFGAGSAAFVSNLPGGLVANAASIKAQSPPVIDALPIGVDLRPNLSVTRSLATILWLAALRREGEQVSFGRFIRVGAVVMPRPSFARWLPDC